MEHLIWVMCMINHVVFDDGCETGDCDNKFE